MRKHHHRHRTKFPLKTAIIFALIIIAAGIALFAASTAEKRAYVREHSDDVIVTDTSPEFTVAAGIATATRDAVQALNASVSGYVCPADFDSLQKDNPDIYAWITVPGTSIDYPVLRNDDDTYYLNHDQARRYSTGGAIFTETAYNSDTFDDPVTVIYGHRMNDDTMFGMLQKFYSSAENLENYSTIMIYTPERGYRYRIFAAVPYGDAHILAGNDCANPRDYKRLVSGLLSIHGPGSAVSPDYSINYDHKLLILSTCYKGDITRRFLVCSYLEEIFE